jgi:hypothetical protein
MNPKLKPPGTKRLKLNCDMPLSNYASKFNLRRYTKGDKEQEMHDSTLKVGRCRLILSNPR